MLFGMYASGLHDGDSVCCIWELRVYPREILMFHLLFGRRGFLPIG